MPVHVLAAPSIAPLAESQGPTIIALTKGCKSVNVVTDVKDVPIGCGSAVVNADCSIHLLVKVSDVVNDSKHHSPK